MHAITQNEMSKKFGFVALTLFVLLSTAGCKLKIPNWEVNSPLGCDKANNRYFDFQDTKTCIKPTTYEQLYVLDKFRWVNQLAHERPNDTIEIQVGFKNWLTKEQYETLIVNNDKISAIKSITVFYPHLEQSGLTGFYMPRTGEVVTKAGMLEAALKEDKDTFNWAYGNPDLSDYSIGTIVLEMKVKDIIEWWTTNKETIRYIQTILSDIDAAQMPWVPDYPIGGENQTIDWDKESQ